MVRGGQTPRSKSGRIPSIATLRARVVPSWISHFVFRSRSPIHSTEVHFACFLSGGIITAIVVNLPEKKLAKRTSVQCGNGRILDN